MIIFLVSQFQIPKLSNYAIINANIFLKDSIIKNGTIIVKNGKIYNVGKNIKIPNDVLVLDYSGKYVYPGFIEIISEISIDTLKEIEKLRNLGFTIVQIINKDSILRGFTKIVFTEDSIKKVSENSYFVISFQTNKETYPVSLMGTIAKIRQFLYDENLKNVLFLTNKNELNVLRAQKITDEFKLNSLIFGTNKEFRIIENLKKNQNLILPLKFVDSLRKEPSLNELIDWKFSRENPRILVENGYSFALSSNEIKEQNEFLKSLRELSKRMDENKIILSLTLIPAKMLGIDNNYGSIEKGKMANYTITDGNIFSKNSSIFEVWINGIIYRISKYPRKFFGNWEAKINDSTFSLKIYKEGKSLKVKINDKAYSNVYFENNVLEVDNYKFYFSDDGCLNCKYISKLEEEEIKKIKEKENPPKIYKLFPTFKTILIKNGTIWLPDTILENTDIFIKNGKIVEIGKNLNFNAEYVIDATNKHITPGIFDAHSHIAIDGDVNEWSESITPEVRVIDVINPFDINIYRELSGGVTTAHIMHGSANAIGGQNVIIKLKWGLPADSLVYKNAPRTIKFALGENPKRSNWLENSDRYPRSRLGVISIIEDALLKAKNYKGKKNLRMEALKDILDGKIQIHCHAYRQDEMLALMESLKKFGIQLRMFHHALEAYKISKELKRENVYVSTFSDWWSYKFEAYDAIPYNAFITTKNDVLTSLNSDSPELARRLNSEAGKMLKYGFTKETDALKLITLNPAKQFSIDKFIGSLEKGKDADFVIWNGNPLSPYSIVLETWIEGRKFYDREEDLKIRKEIKLLKEKLINEFKNYSE
ncbi:MAG: amidohydrolase family protein [candidate division WOR-3 bacterium]